MINHIKPMNINEMILALDRISRFKFPEKKLKRVYIETICSHLISPSFKKSDVEKFDNKSLKDYFTQIWNNSIESNFGILSNENKLNINYIEQEKKCYQLSKEILNLMPDNADFETLINNIKKIQIPNEFNEYKTPKKVVLTEGITEEILLPVFLKQAETDRQKARVEIIGIGGKSRTLKFYNTFKEQLKIPVYILLDKDALPIFEEVKTSLRNIDKAHLISKGEFEDVIPKNLFKNAINSEFKLQAKISVNDFEDNLSMVENLHEIYRKNGFGEFKKSKMAQLVKQSLPNKLILNGELKTIINEIINL